MQIIERMSGWLARPGALWWAVGLAVVLTLPALATGLIMDDFVHRLALADDAPGYLARAPHDLYRFILDSDSWKEEAFDAGWLPWFADPELHGELWRPVSSLTLAADNALWRDHPPLAHAHSMLWYAALVLAVGLLFRELSPLPWVGALATILYAIDDAHGQAVAWLANRHALVSTVFAVLALLAHVRWRKDGWRPGAVLAPAALLVGLLAGETALALTAYLFAFALFLDRGSPWNRALSLLPCALVSLAWRAAYNLLGYGTRGMGATYLDPVADPLRYAAALPERLVLLLQAQLFPIPAETPVFFGNYRVLTLIAVVPLALLLALSWHWIRRDRLAAFWLTGMVVAALPACAIVATDRMLFPLGLGGMGLVAQLLAGSSEADLGRYWQRRSVRVLAIAMLVSHGILAPLLLPARTYVVRPLQAVLDSAVGSLERLGDLEGKTLVVVRGFDSFWTSLYAVPMRRAAGLRGPERIRTLATGTGAVWVSRLDRSSLRLEVDRGIMTTLFDAVVRDAPFRPGDTVRRDPMTIEVRAVTADGRPSELLCTFAGGLEAPDRVFTFLTNHGYQPFALPEIGDTVELEALELGQLLTFRYQGGGDV